MRCLCWLVVVDGVWADWGVWDSCSLSCGGGQRQRSRNCTGPYHDGLPCPDSPEQQEGCNTQPCPGTISLHIIVLI